MTELNVPVAPEDSSSFPPFPRVTLCVMSREQINLAAHVSIVQVMDKVAYHLALSSGPYLDAGRNKCVATAMNIRDETGALAWDWFMFTDSDVQFTPAHLEILFGPTVHPSYNPIAYPVIGGVYVNPFDDGGVPGEEATEYSGFFGPVAYEWTEVDNLPGLEGVPTPTFRRYSRKNLATLPPVDMPWNPPGTDVSPSPICQVAALGTGFLAIHASLLTRMLEHYGVPLPWFDEPVIGGVHFGEDMGFAARLADLGYPVLAHRGCTPIHHKTTMLV